MIDLDAIVAAALGDAAPKKPAADDDLFAGFEPDPPVVIPKTTVTASLDAPLAKDEPRKVRGDLRSKLVAAVTQAITEAVERVLDEEGPLPDDASPCSETTKTRAG